MALLEEVEEDIVEEIVVFSVEAPATTDLTSFSLLEACEVKVTVEGIELAEDNKGEAGTASVTGLQEAGFESVGVTGLADVLEADEEVVTIVVVAVVVV